MKTKNLLLLILLNVSFFVSYSQCPPGYTNTSTFNYTGSVQTFVVPYGVSELYIQAKGAQGAPGDGSGGGTAGLGGSVSGILSVTPGQTLNIYVGGSASGSTGGYNGGGNGGNINGGGGGGASDIRINGTALTDRIIVAGGGGGGGSTGCVSAHAGGSGGGGGGLNGGNGTDSPNGGGGFGGAVGVGGAEGIGCGGFLGAPGTVPNGGNGQGCCCATTPGGGGGGGGYVQGGGGGGGSAGTTGCSGNDKGGGGGGAGGSNYTDIGINNITLTNNINSGDGSVLICYTPVYCPSGGSWISQTFTYTGSMQSMTIPLGVTDAYVVAFGANGANGSGPGGGLGAGGSVVAGQFNVNGGDVLNIYVGGSASGSTGGYNGGGNGGNIGGGGGGGASDIRINGTALTDRIIVAGGGGGGGSTGCVSAHAGGSGGGGGGLNGGNGTDSPNGGGGFGGAVGVGGAEGIGCGGFLGAPGTVPNGGNGQGCCCATTPGGGGGGGGYVQGGGGGGGSAGTTGCSGNDKGGGGGGAGGSNLTSILTSIDTINGFNIGDGFVNICYLCLEPDLATVADDTICIGESSTLSITAGNLNNALDWYWYQDSCGGTLVGMGTSITVNPSSTTTYYVRGEGACFAAGSCSMVTVNVTALPTVSLTVSDTLLCSNDAPITLTGSPSGGSFSGVAVSGTTFNPAVSGSGVFVAYYDYTDNNGCSGADSIMITVNANLSVSVSVTDTLLCSDESAVTLTGSPSGGSFSGVGVSGSSFDPNISGLGTFVVYYDYTDGNGCSGSDSLSITVETCVGITSFTKMVGSIKIYPNPFTNNIHIELNALENSKMKIKLLDVVGKEVYSENINTHKGRNSFALENQQSLPGGIYYLRFEEKGKIFSIKLFKTE